MHEFVHVTEMMKEDQETFIAFVQKMADKSQEYLDFVKGFGEESACVNIQFYELDSDEYNYPVFQWRVAFTPSDKNRMTFKGYFTEDYYKLTNKKTKHVEVEGDYFAVKAFAEKDNIEDLTAEEYDDLFEVELYDFDKCQAWIQEIAGFELVFVPDENY